LFHVCFIDVRKWGFRCPGIAVSWWFIIIVVASDDRWRMVFKSVS
jgi:hypothetical protein